MTTQDTTQNGRSKNNGEENRNLPRSGNNSRNNRPSRKQKRNSSHEEEEGGQANESMNESFNASTRTTGSSASSRKGRPKRPKQQTPSSPTSSMASSMSASKARHRRQLRDNNNNNSEQDIENNNNGGDSDNSSTFSGEFPDDLPGAVRVSGTTTRDSFTDTIHIGSNHIPLNNSDNREGGGRGRHQQEQEHTAIIAHLAPNIEEEIERRLQEHFANQPAALPPGNHNNHLASSSSGQGATPTATPPLLVAEAVKVAVNDLQQEQEDDYESLCCCNDGCSYKKSLLFAVIVLVLAVVVLVVVMISTSAASGTTPSPSPSFSSPRPTTAPPNDGGSMSMPSLEPTTSRDSPTNPSSPIPLVPGQTPVSQPPAAVSSSSPSPSPNNGIFSDRFEFLFDTIGSDVSASPDIVFRDTSTSQYRALRWLADIDEVTLPTGSDLSNIINNDSLINASKEVWIQRYVLVLIYYTTMGEMWDEQLDFLSPTTNFCEWNTRHKFDCLDRGIDCSEHHELLGLVLYNNNLVGTIPTELGLLTTLRGLSLVGNTNIRGTIPTELGRLTDLVALYLSENQLSGTIPTELGNLLLIEELYLSQNMLMGTVPTELSNLLSNHRLQTLSVWGNDNLQHDIPQ